MDNKLVVASNTQFDAPPGRSLSAISMVRDVAYAPECLSKLDEMRVYAYNGIATDNFQVYHTEHLGPAAAAGGLHADDARRHQRPDVPDRGAGPVPPTATFSASPTSIAARPVRRP